MKHQSSVGHLAIYCEIQIRVGIEEFKTLLSQSSIEGDAFCHVPLLANCQASWKIEG